MNFKEEYPYRIGSCDFCGAENIYIKEFQDEGIHVLDRCFYDCEDKRNIPDEAVECIEIISISCLERSYCWDSKWEVQVKIDGTPNTFQIIRYETEDTETLLQELKKCRNQNDITRLNKNINYY